ncbi:MULTISPECIES: flagellar basal body P-ring formation chaperone FlgA [unclassified Brenneria]|uniref:flagellar basal body P-ring formation chaperone FlgA n=1 Tax=unclassified Brenneria TaxID=2634434 RepID=UPI0029C1CA12|nr:MULTISPECIES: flagellar basal body P-ring formation chaperone FlgA [unclassified Brenneria]MDX5630699.1 flagellar basal body P-ring formation chaperone FlgA [Brenneria sp. L3-3Z]MDX5694249.1 flagellar basal body P-ring formation chaperone FlgA [Brenneria sp. L4-2C]
MKRQSNLIWLLICLSVSPFGHAAPSDLATQINEFFSARYKASPNTTVKVVVKSPQSQWPQCERPQISLPTSTRTWGNISVSVRCGQQRKFIQTEVQVTGHYVVSSRIVNRGAKLENRDLRLTKGRLDQLPPRAIHTLSEAEGAITLRDLTPGQPITASMLRRAWIIKAGQNVQVFAQGEGFTINSEGKAMNNAAVGQSVRVRTASGQVISGVAGEDGIILIPQ